MYKSQRRKITILSIICMNNNIRCDRSNRKLVNVIFESSRFWCYELLTPSNISAYVAFIALHQDIPWSYTLTEKSKTNEKFNIIRFLNCRQKIKYRSGILTLTLRVNTGKKHKCWGLAFFHLTQNLSQNCLVNFYR